MDDLDDNISSSGFEPLFIKEEAGDPEMALMEQEECNTNLHGVTFAAAQVKQSSLITPYLQEMDDLLKSCEELNGISFGSQYTEASLNESSHVQGTEEVTVQKYGETWKCPQAYLSTSYIDTHIEGTKEMPVQGQSQSMGTIINRCGVTSERSRPTEMPLTSAGNKLSKTMVEYEGQLLGMLAMLESCMEEAGMDFEPQDWVTEESQEYVHINKNPQLYKGTTLVPIQQERPLKMESQPMQLDSWEEGQVSKDTRNRMTAGSTTNGSQQKDLSGCDTMGGFSVERSERQGHLKTDKGFGFLGTPSDTAEKDPVYCEGTQPEHMFEESMETMEDASEIDVDDSELSSEERHELKTDTLDLGSGMKELGALRTRMEDCIEGVQRLQKRRVELLVAVLQLRGEKGQEEAKMASEEETEEWIDSKVADLMDVLKKEEEGRREERKREIKCLREERAEEERRMWKINLERQGLQDELRKLKRRLFAMARDCAHSQAALNNQRREVELLKREEEKLNSLMLQLTEEGYQLRLAQQQQLSDLIAKLQDQSSSQITNTAEELTECRRHSCGDIQQYLQGGLRALEDRYEPILLALLKRREATAGALVKAKEQAQELRAQLRPLREEIERLKLQRACLEEKLKLIHMQRRENVGQYKETVHCLEDSSRELKTELKIQKRKTEEIKELRNSLAEQLLLYRDTIEDHNKGEDEEKT